MMIVAHVIKVQLTKLELQLREPNDVRSLYEAGIQISLRKEIDFLKQLLTYTKVPSHEDAHERTEILF